SLSAAVENAASAARGAPQPARIGSLVAETIVLVNPARNYAQFLLRALLPMVLHVVIALAAATRWAPNSTAAACAPGSPAPAVIRSSRWPASLRPCSPSFSSSC